MGCLWAPSLYNAIDLQMNKASNASFDTNYLKQWSSQSSSITDQCKDALGSDLKKMMMTKPANPSNIGKRVFGEAEP